MQEYPWSAYEDYRIELVGNETISSATVLYTTKQWAARVDVLGENGFLMLDLESMNVVHYRRSDLKTLPVGLSLLTEAGQLAAAFVANSWRKLSGRVRTTHEIIISQFIDSILSGGTPPVTAEQGREAVRVLNMIVDNVEKRFGGRTAQAVAVV
jgi:predicted dehydrogenase